MVLDQVYSACYESLLWKRPQIQSEGYWVPHNIHASIALWGTLVIMAWGVHREMILIDYFSP